MATMSSGDPRGDFSEVVHRHGRSIVWVESTTDSCVIADTDDFRQFGAHFFCSPFQFFT